MTIRRCLIIILAGVVAGAGSSGLALAHSGGSGSHGGGGSNGGSSSHVGGRAHAGGSWHIGSWHGGAHRGGWNRGGMYGHGGGWRNGLFFASLPRNCATYWWGGMPYYYADDTFYLWNSNVSEYETVLPPAELASQVGSAAATELFVFPEGGQTPQQQALDQHECDRWAVDQSGFDPTWPVPASGGASTGRGGRLNAGEPTRAEYLRAQSACLTGRNYSVE